MNAKVKLDTNQNDYQVGGSHYQAKVKLDSNPNDYQVGGSHYQDSTSDVNYQHWDCMWECQGVSYFRSQISRYVSRYKRKNGKQDLGKALQYSHKLLSKLSLLINEDSTTLLVQQLELPEDPSVTHVATCKLLEVLGLSYHELPGKIMYTVLNGTTLREFQDVHEAIQQLLDETYPEPCPSEPCRLYVDQDRLAMTRPEAGVFSSEITGTKQQSVVKIFPKHPSTKTPVYANIGDAGMDVHANLTEHKTDFQDRIALIIAPGERRLVNTGLHVAVPHGFMIQVCSRSGLAAKNGVVSLISPGIIDSGYRGELKICLFNSSNERFVVEHGDRIAQLIVQHTPYLDLQVVSSIEELGSSDRGSGGFGSSGIK